MLIGEPFTFYLHLLTSALRLIFSRRAARVCGMGSQCISQQQALAGVWVSPSGDVHTTYRSSEGDSEVKTDSFKGFGWVRDRDLDAEGFSGDVTELKGMGPLNRLIETDTFDLFKQWLSKDGFGRSMECIRPFESQYLLKNHLRLFQNMRFDQLKRCQVDIETDSGEDGAFSNPYKDRILAIGMKMGTREKMICLESEDREGEKVLLESFVEILQQWDPDIIEGHNIFSFDLNYLKIRSGKRKVPCAWGRYGQTASFRKSRLKVAERWIDFQRCDIPGRTVFDTYLMVQIYDITSRDMPGYGLKKVAKYFGVTRELGHERTYIEGSKIHEQFRANREQFLEYLRDDLLETEGVAGILLPTYFEQVKSFPVLLQESCLRGTSSKIDLLFFEKYYHAKQALPFPSEGFATFEGGYTRSFQDGVFRHVMHYDVASLYPSLLLKLNANPWPDDLGVFLPMLEELRDYRLKYKKLAKTDPDPALRKEYNARQASFKILINSFYGYLGFPGARFGDAELAAKVTSEGRELLQLIINTMESLDAKPLEADTDGIYVASEKWAKDPLGLLNKVQVKLPEGIELELGGEYVAMLCYKAKNYALNDGGKVLIRGSALRSRGTEPFLSDLTKTLIHSLLGATGIDPREELEQWKKNIGMDAADVSCLAKTETLNQTPSKYQKAVEEGGKPRRAALEVALRMKPVPRMGERITYYVGPKEKGKTAMWQRAFSIDEYDALTCPYDAGTYLKKLKDWETKYVDLLALLNQTQ